MSRAQEIFERLRQRGMAALEDLIADREPESLFLDFKRSPQDGVARVLSPEDNRNLSKAISGFGNSSGGVIVWGVDCRRDAGGNEVAQKHPLADANGFSTKIQSAISRTTVPPHPGVQVTFFDEPERGPTGYVAVYVPQSGNGPIRSLNTSHYHVRTGSDFSIISHDVLAGMFGRPPQPRAEINVISYPARLDDGQHWLTVAFGFVAVNLGAVIGERPHLSGHFGAFPSDGITVTSKDPVVFSVRRGSLPTFSVVSTPGVLLIPGATEHMCDIVMHMRVDQLRAIHLKCTIGVLGAPPTHFALAASEEQLRESIERVRGGGCQSTEIVQLVPET